MSVEKFTHQVLTADGSVAAISIHVVEQPSLPSTREFSPDELREGFKLVTPATNWKDPIDAEIDEDKMELVDRAIAFMAYGGAQFDRLGNGRVRVTAPGYYGMEALLEAQQAQEQVENVEEPIPQPSKPRNPRGR